MILKPEEQATGLASIRRLAGEAGWTEAESQFYFLKFIAQGYMSSSTFAAFYTKLA